MTISSLAKMLVGVNNIAVENLDFSANDNEIIISVRPYKRDHCRCGICGRKALGYDSENGVRRWRAMDIGNSVKVYVESKAVRVNCSEHGVVVQQFPWARHKSRFTKNFEETAVWMSLHMSRKAVSEYLRVSWDTVGPIISRVENEISKNTNLFYNLVNIGIDETSYKKGHKYITIVVNHDTKTVVWVQKGFGKEVLEEFFKGLTEEQKSSIKLVSGDGARWIESTVHKFCPKAIFGIDPFHVVSWCTEVLDAVRKEKWNNARNELKKANDKSKAKSKGKCGRPKGGKKDKTKLALHVETVRSAKYPLLMNPENLSETYRAKLQQILLRDRRLATAYRLKEDLRLIFKMDISEVPNALEKWRRRAWSCRIPQFVELQRRIKRHKNAIISTIRHGISNARIEATNNKIKLSVRMAYGFRNIENLISMIMLRCGGLPVSLPGR